MVVADELCLPQLSLPNSSPVPGKPGGICTRNNNKMLELLELLQTSRRKWQGLAFNNQLGRGKRRGRGGSSRVCAILVGLGAWELDVATRRRSSSDLA